MRTRRITILGITLSSSMTILMMSCALTSYAQGQDVSQDVSLDVADTSDTDWNEATVDANASEAEIIDPPTGALEKINNLTTSPIETPCTIDPDDDLPHCPEW